MADATDIVLLTHNRLDHLIKTVDALEERTRAPFRLTVVENASGPALRNWLAANRGRFERVLLRPSNEHVPAFQHGIDATSSDPYVVTDPDLVVPAGEPCWLERLLELMARHEDFGLVGAGLDPANRPDVLPAEQIDSARLVDGEIVEEPVGTWFQTIRRAAFSGPYYSDSRTCLAVQRAGFRVGWTPTVRALHLGWDDFRLHPEHLVAKNALGGFYPRYAEVDLLPRPPALLELATAAPVVAETRSRGIGDDSVLELTWGSPVVAAAVPAAVPVAGPVGATIELPDDAASAVVLIEPPREHAVALATEACRIATKLVVAVATLTAFEGRLPADVAPTGWRGFEAPSVSEAVRELAGHGDRGGPDAQTRYETLGRREEWLELFEHARFGAGEQRLFVFEPEDGGSLRSGVSLGSSGTPLRLAPRQGAVRRPRGLRRLSEWLGAHRPAH